MLPTPSSQSSKVAWFSLTSWFKNLRIQQKISLGYLGALGVAIAGTTTGILVGNHYQSLAEKYQEDALEENQFLKGLQVDLLKTLTHRQLLIDRLETPEAARREHEFFRQSLESSEQIWADLKASYIAPEVEETSEELEAFENLVANYDGVIQQYREQSETLLQILSQMPLSPQETQFARSRSTELNLNSTSVKFASLINSIEQLIIAVEDEYEEAQADLQYSRRLKTQIIFGSMIASISVATLLAIYTSCLISQPIQMATKVARQISEENNFDLKVPVSSQDEIGQLNTTLNDLIDQVKQLLEKQEKTQNNLIQAEKMSSLGQLVAGIAHEINNPVNFIHGNLQHIEEYTQELLKLVHLYQKSYPNPTPEIQEALDQADFDFLSEDLSKILYSVQTGTNRICEIIQSLRNFSRTDEADFKAVDIHLGLESTLMILGHRTKAKPESPEIQIIREYGQIPLVECYPGPLNQVFMNLLSNAIDALEESDQTKSYQEIKANPKIIRLWTESLDNQWIAIHIADNGPGMSQAVKSRLFDPFFTTKPIGKGTGLGLSISYQIVIEQHKGKLDCYSIPGKGTEFVIQIPVWQKQPLRTDVGQLVSKSGKVA
jgi:signal transduction histidine kinase